MVSKGKRISVMLGLASGLVALLAIVVGLLQVAGWLATLLLAVVALVGLRTTRALAWARRRAIWDAVAEGELAEQRRRQAERIRVTSRRHVPAWGATWRRF